MPISADANIHYSLEDGVFIIQIDRPDKKNALLPGMYRALGDGIVAAEASAEANVILIRGTEDCFTSGNDVNSFVAGTTPTEERPSVHFMHALHAARKPLIAAVNGLAIGIGTTLLLHCDLVYAAENSFLQLPFTRLGLCPEAGSSFLLPQQIGYRRAAELLLLGDRFDAHRGREYGIVTEVLAPGQCDAHALARAKTLAALPPNAVQTSKRLMKQSVQDVVPSVIAQELVEFGALLQTDDAQAIMQAFLAKKKTA
jgi:enoyl-CoA hydratase/carnithine racemase